MIKSWEVQDNALVLNFELDEPESRSGECRIFPEDHNPELWRVEIRETNPGENMNFNFGAIELTTLPKAISYAERAVDLLGELHNLPDHPDFQ